MLPQGFGDRAIGMLAIVLVQIVLTINFYFCFVIRMGFFVGVAVAFVDVSVCFCWRCRFICFFVDLYCFCSFVDFPN